MDEKEYLIVAHNIATPSSLLQ